ncbi:MAG: serine hydrolase domain-containing protein [Eubacteriales bacterium]|nr:serine hydrolase [Clostridiales bacterium]
MNLEERLDALTEKIKSADIPVINMAVYSDGDFAMRQVNFSAGALNCYSITKNFTATAVGLAVCDGKLRLSDRVIDFFGRDELPEKISDGWQDVTVHHILTHTTGQRDVTLFESDRYDPARERNWLRRCFAIKIKKEPGTHYVYSNTNYYLAAAVASRAVGEDVELYLRRRLLEPLGFGPCAFERSHAGDIMGATGLFTYTHDMWKLGYVYMSGGLTPDGRRLLDEEWVRAATSDQVKIESAPRYGYSFWLRDRGFACTGTNGQIVRVVPERDFVFAAHGAGEVDYNSLLAEFFDI